MHEPNLSHHHTHVGGRPKPGILRRFATVQLFLLGVVASGCDLDAAGPAPEVAWIAEILPFPQEDPELQIDFDATIGMISGAGETRVSLAVQGAPAGTVFGWAVRTGNCAGVGIPVTLSGEAFDPVTINVLGEAQRLLVLVGNVPTNGSYAAEILVDPSVGTIVLGCSNMVGVD